MYHIDATICVCLGNKKSWKECCEDNRIMHQNEIFGIES